MIMLETKEKNLIMLINDVCKLFRNEMRNKTEDVGILDTYRPILRVLGCNNGCTQVHIARFTKLKAPTISLTLNNMEKDGLITRKENTEDKRITNIYITEAGIKINEKLHEMAEQTKNEFLLGISEKSINEAKEVLIKILENAERNL